MTSRMICATQQEINDDKDDEKSHRQRERERTPNSEQNNKKIQTHKRKRLNKSSLNSRKIFLLSLSPLLLSSRNFNCLIFIYWSSSSSLVVCEHRMSIFSTPQQVHSWRNIVAFAGQFQFLSLVHHTSKVNINPSICAHF